MRFGLLEGVMLALGLIFIAPTLLAALNSVKSLPEIAQSPVALPKHPNLNNYAYLFQQANIGRPMLNSFLMTVAVILGLLLLAPPAAFSITRRLTSTGPLLRGLFIAGLAIPFQVLMVPLLQEFRWLGIQFTYFALWLHYISWGLPLCVFIYSAFLDGVPRSLEEAAVIDGCGPIRTFWKIIFPILRPCTATVVVFWGLWIWNDFMQAFVMMGASHGDLAFLQLWKFLSDKYVKNWNVIFAGVVVLSMPVTILYVLMQSRFEKGLTAGSVK
ncbi:MAG TPA: carbohydrate ABC transporter permease [Fimbriimonadaceae bacterium]|jgi:raffinose/stachyose/melibiose transport system permease protein